MSTKLSATEKGYDLRRVLDAWNPDEHPTHCSNCLHAKVSGSPDAPTVRCAQGHRTTPAGKRDIELARLIRRKLPRGFRSAVNCPDFTSMSGGAA